MEQKQSNYLSESQAAVESDEEGSSLLENKKNKLTDLIKNTYKQL
jgi:hypothetical protein